MSSIGPIAVVTLIFSFIGFLVQERAKNKAAHSPQSPTCDPQKVSLGRRFVIAVGAAVLLAAALLIFGSVPDWMIATPFPYVFAWFFMLRGHIWAWVMLILLFSSGLLLALLALVAIDAHDGAWIFLLAVPCQLVLLSLTLSPATREYMRDAIARRSQASPQGRVSPQ